MSTFPKHVALARRSHRVRTQVRGTTERPRLTVFRSAKGIYAQVIDDTKGVTIASANDTKSRTKGTPLERAKEIGKSVAEAAKAKKITTVVFDRGGYRYHGRVKAVAEAARAAGLTF